MTLIVGAHLDRYVMLAADTRVVYYPPGLPTFYLDEDSKIQTTRMGIVAGAGYTALIDAVKKRFLNDPIQHTSHLLAVIREERHKIRGQSFMDDPRCGKALDTTSWFFTYVNFTNDHPEFNKLRLAMFHPSLSESELGILKAGDVVVHVPGECGEEVAGGLRPAIQKMLEEFAANESLAESIHGAASVLGNVMNQMGEQFDVISRTFTIGIHIHPDAVAISNITTIDQPFELETRQLFKDA